MVVCGCLTGVCRRICVCWVPRKAVRPSAGGGLATRAPYTYSFACAREPTCNGLGYPRQHTTPTDFRNGSCFGPFLVKTRTKRTSVDVRGCPNPHLKGQTRTKPGTCIGNRMSLVQAERVPAPYPHRVPILSPSSDTGLVPLKPGIWK